MMTSDDKVGGWVKKGQNHDAFILECPLVRTEETWHDISQASINPCQKPTLKCIHSTKLDTNGYNPFWKVILIFKQQLFDREFTTQSLEHKNFGW